IPGSRKQKELLAGDVERIAGIYREFKRRSSPAPEAGFCGAVSTTRIVDNKYTLNAGRYVGTPEMDEGDEPIETKLTRLSEEVRQHFAESDRLRSAIVLKMKAIGYGW